MSLKTGEVRVLERGGYYGRYVPSGNLIYVHDGVLFSVRFDPDRLEVTGAPTPVVEDVAANSISGGGQLDTSGVGSGTGTLAYLQGKELSQSWRVAWLDRSENLLPITSSLGVYAIPRFSPDGKKLAFTNGTDVYVQDIERDAVARLTFTGASQAQLWAPDGRHIIFEDASAGFSLFWIRSDGASEPQKLLTSPRNVVPWSVSPDGKRLAYFEADPETGQDLWILPLDLSDPDHPSPGKPEIFLRTAADELCPMFSPDGRWVAYRSTESGSSEVYVRPFLAGRGGKWQISTGGGLYGVWSRNGRELFYETADYRIMVVEYTVDGNSFLPGKPRLWSDKQLFYMGRSNLDLAPDGKRFAVLTAPEGTNGNKGSVHVTMLLNFFDELRRRIPAK